MPDPRTVRQQWDRRAPYYDRAVNERTERWAVLDSRDWICGQAHGPTLEVAIGTGRNLAHYPPEVDLTGVDISPGMLAVAQRRARELGRPVLLREAAAEALPFPDASFDSVVCTLSVCSVADRSEAIAEMIRVLRPGGRLLLLDHLERRWLRGRPATLALRQGVITEQRQRLRLGLIERFAGRKPA
ncbi:MAG TPA: class I SAM-dependent methyltransferase [Micromonosporaceae bacterium]